MVGRRAHPAGPHDERVVVLRAAHAGCGEARSELDTTAGGDAEHRLGQIGVQLVEDRVAQSCRDAADRHDDPAAHGVPFGAHRLDPLGDGRRRPGIGAEDGARIHVGFGDGVRIDLRFDRFHRPDAGHYLDSTRPAQQLAGHGAGGDPAHRLPSRGPAAAARIADPVAGQIGVIRVRRAQDVLEFRVVLASGRPVAHQQQDRGAQGQAFVDAGQDLHRVRFRTGRRVGQAGTAARELHLDLLSRDGQSGRTSVHDAAHGRAV